MRRLLQLPLHWQIAWGMILGAAVGVGLNLSAGDRRITLSGATLPDGWRSVRIHDQPHRIEIEVEPAEGAPRRWIIESVRTRPEHLGSLDELRARDPQAYRLYRRHGRSPARRVGQVAHRIGGIFLRLLRMVSIPLIITSLATGIMGLGRAGRLGRLFGHTLLYYLVTSMLAIMVGLVMVNTFRPGVRTEQVAAVATTGSASGQSLGEVLYGQIEAMIPTNPIGAAARSEFLSVISFTILFSVFTIWVGGSVAERLRQLAADAFDVMMAITMAVIRLAPLGVLFLMLYVTATQGAAVFASLAWYMGTVAAGLAVHALITLPLILKFVARRSPLGYARALSPALLTAFSSASSNGTLPLTMTCVEQEAGISNRVSSFVLPLGATVNMDGTALYEAVAVLFIAQLHHGGNLPLAQQMIVAFTALLASIGAAGIPHAGLVMMTIILQAVGLPVEMQGVILAVDRVLDMCRTSVNVWSDSCGCAVVARWEHE